VEGKKILFLWIGYNDRFIYFFLIVNAVHSGFWLGLAV